MDILVGDVLRLKKPHPCGAAAVDFTVLRAGADIRIKCNLCAHEVMVPRVKLEKNIKSVTRE